MKPLTIVYITGSGRSGSTLLDRAIGSIPGASSLNEVNGIFEHASAAGRPCSCGVPFERCEFWQSVMTRTLQGEHPGAAARAAARFDRSRMFPALYAGLLGARSRRELAAYRDLLRRLFASIADEAGADVLVDSSKIPTRALVLAGLPDIDLRLIHLIRDPRAVAYSWRRDKYDPGRGGDMDRYPVARTMTFWVGRQLLAGLLGRRIPMLRVRYEDFTAAPRAALERVVEFVPALEGRPLPVRGQHTLDLTPLHTISGNPDRFAGGPTEVRCDERWRGAALAPRLERAFRVIRPLARRYGYG